MNGRRAARRIVGRYSCKTFSIPSRLPPQRPSYQQVLERPFVRLRDENLHCKNHDDKSPEYKERDQYKGYLQCLPRDLLPLGEVLFHFARNRIRDGLFGLEGWTVDLQGSDASHIPAKAQISLL